MSKKIRTLIVDDSLFARVMLKKMLEKHSNDFEVIGFATNGLEAVEFVSNNENIDLITMDVNMPIMNGLEAVTRILEKKDIPIVMISVNTKAGAKETIKALENGAIDFVNKNNLDTQNTFDNIEIELIRKLKVASRAVVMPIKIVEKKEKNVGINERFEKIVGIGCSTGGPNALKAVLSGLKEGFKYPIIVAQHMPEGGYSESMAMNLNDISFSIVKIVEHGERVVGGVIYVCPGGYNVEIAENNSSYYLKLNKEKDGYYMPSVDKLFLSLANLKKLEKIAVVMTGMGNDGLKGAITLDEGENQIIVESAKTAVVYGMPKKIMESKLIKNKIELDLHHIAKKLNEI